MKIKLWAEPLSSMVSQRSLIPLLWMAAITLTGCAGSSQPTAATSDGKTDVIVDAPAPQPVKTSVFKSPVVTTSKAVSPKADSTKAAPPQAAAEQTAANLPGAVGPILVVDTERKGKSNRDVARINTALHGAGAHDTRVVHAWELDDAMLVKLHPRALVLSGQGTPWWDYDKAELQREERVLRGAQLPMLGICGGHQLIAMAFGGQVAPIRKTGNGPGYEGCQRERGWLPVSLQADAPLFRGKTGDKMWFNHCEEVKDVPSDFVRIGTDGRGANQAIRHRTRPIYGVQFHPEIATGSNSFGRTVMRNFLAIVDGNSAAPPR